MSDPLVDVLITGYNNGDRAAEAIESILRQTVKDIRIIFVDDGSTDDTTPLVLKFSRLDSRVVLLRIRHGGIVEAANYGLQHVQAPFLARMDADDISEPDRFHHQLAVLQKNHEIVAISGAHDHIDSQGRVVGTGYFERNPMAADARTMPQRAPYLPHPFLMVRLEALESIGKRYRHFALAEDVDLCWRLKEVGIVYNTSKKLGNYRVHSGSTTAKSIFSGRVAATYSQLAGISALRRCNGCTDFDIPIDPLIEIDPDATLDQITAYASGPLREEEKSFFHMCVAAKILDLLKWRDYQPEISDYNFVSKWLSLRALQDFPTCRIDIENSIVDHFVRLVKNRDINRGLAYIYLMKGGIIKRVIERYVYGKVRSVR